MLNGEPWTRFVLDLIEESKSKDDMCLLIEFDETVENVFQKTAKLLKSIRKKVLILSKNNDQKEKLAKENTEASGLLIEVSAFESLINHVLIQSYSDPTDLVSLVEDLETCFKNMWQKEAISKKRKTSEEIDIVPVDVLVDIFLSLLSKPSAPLRALILDIFKVFSSKISEKSLEIIFDVLKSANGPAGAEDIFEEDEEIEDMQDENKEEITPDQDDNSSDTSDDELDVFHQEQIGEEDDDNGLNDDDMEEYDSKLAEIFKQRSLNQTQKKGNICLVNQKI